MFRSIAGVAALGVAAVLGIRVLATRFPSYPISLAFLAKSPLIENQFGDLVDVRLAYLDGAHFGMVGHDVFTKYTFVLRGSESEGLVRLSLGRTGGEWRLSEGVIERVDGSVVHIAPQILEPQAGVDD